MRYREHASRDLDAAINILVTLLKLIERKQITDIEARNKLNEVLNKLESVDNAIKLS
jgi:hypothetical protein